MRKNILFIPLLIFLAGTFAFAEQKEMSFDVSPFWGWEKWDSKFSTNEDMIGGLRFAWNITKNIGLEAHYDLAESNMYPVNYSVGGDKYKEEIDYTLATYGVNFLWNFETEIEKWVPYVTVGVGMANVEGDWSLSINGTKSDALSDDDSGFMYDYGVGVKKFFNDWIAFRFDLRGLTYKVWDSADAVLYQWDGNTRNLQASIGVTIQFGVK
ncbi:MAG: outer membrane beta-barrel domain-containing protein [Acidobacteriota bacterium]